MADYSPRNGSIVWQVIEFLNAHPDEQLDAKSIAGQFGGVAEHIHAQFRPAVETRLLERRTDPASRKLMYVLGRRALSFAPRPLPTETRRLSHLLNAFETLRPSGISTK
ncbi:hypothetical protein SAMN04489707_1001159 [Paenacidovorax caeni]|uniref:Penicillinase repressor n=1 Tax=Paenacidovorax caeni TaxID=343013 RepID=A0A1I7F414_9BURK|nr:hypothetical protein [Paenacidovorax caeni]SFU30941.1 hypothetical protein SAMN04489707_1001159 [Paenacidovorax caeni]